MFTPAKRNTFSIMFYINRTKTNKEGKHPIYCKVTVQGKSRQFSTQSWVLNSKWNVSASKMIGTSEDVKTINTTLKSIEQNLNNIRANLYEQGKAVTAEVVVNIHTGKGDKEYSLLDIHAYHNEHYVKQLIGKDFAEGTYGRYKTSYDHVVKFLAYKYNLSDIKLKDITFHFATDYEFYLKTVRNCAHNTAVKYIKNLKAVLNYAVRKEWLEFNPLNRYKSKLDRVDKGYLTQNELDAIKNKKLDNERIAEVRDVFVFCCYTGLAYADVFKLSDSNIVIGINGKKEINTKRTKTNTIVKVPLLDEAQKIIDKYKDHPLCLYTGKLLPVKSNQKQNAYLKEIAELCNCDKNLTTHIARHTFATLMLTLGITMEAVSSMLGHTDIKTTQIYGKIIAQKIIDEMDIVNIKLNNNLQKSVNG